VSTGKKQLWLMLILILVMIPIPSLQAQPPAANQEEERPLLVGCISHIEGNLLRYVPNEEDWVETVRDTPFGINDTLYSNKETRAEIIMPNNTWMRIDSDTQIQLITIKDDVTEIDVLSGVVRFYNKGSDAVIQAATPLGYVMGPPGTGFDLIVDHDYVEVIASKGTVYFDHNTAGKQFEAIAGSSSIIANRRQVTAGDAVADPYWDEWNMDRDALWAKRIRTGRESVRYLPPGLYHHSYVLERHGRWQRVYYDGAYYYFWRPVHLTVGWAPFTVGRWTAWYGEHTWIPYEPFGYVTHHYGSWVLVNGFWYWAPPTARIRAHPGPPLLDIGFAWYPGRVAWIHSGVHIGWVPLAPYEPYYCHRRWGRRTIVVRDVNITNVYNVTRYRYLKHAILIHRKNLYKVNNYRNVRIRNIKNRTIVKKYRVVPVVNETVIRDYRKTRKKYNFANNNVKQKPHVTVIKRIQQNRLDATKNIEVKARSIQQNGKNIRQHRIGNGAKIKNPKARKLLVPADQDNRSVSKVIHKQQFQNINKRNIKTQELGKVRKDRQIEAWKLVQENRRHNSEKNRSISSRALKSWPASSKRATGPSSISRSYPSTIFRSYGAGGAGGAGK